MARMRVGVALLVPTPFSHELDGLRRALGSDALHRIAPHVTLVPPVNLRSGAIGEALAVVRAGASGSRPLRLRLGPPATFAPATPTVHLAVQAPVRGLQALRTLRDAVFVAPLARKLTHPFEPHVTLDEDVDPARIATVLASLGDYSIDVVFERVHLLEERQRDDGIRYWVPVADVPLAPRVIVGRGGIELELTVSSLIDPEALALFATLGRTPPDPHAAATVVAARRRGELVGVATSAPGEEEPIVLVARDHRGQGIADQLRRALDHAMHD